ncbi:MAG: YdcF family protein [Mariprofundus sp.]|nr:YdcF family protein [Mariprofundus sp.]
MESKANNTWENAVNLQRTLKSGEIHIIVLVTSAWHMPRSIRVFEQHGFDVMAAPYGSTV